MKRNSENARNLGARTAAEWLALLEAGNVDQATRGDFLAWLKAKPENESDYEICEAVMAVADKLAPEPGAPDQRSDTFIPVDSIPHMEERE